MLMRTHVYFVTSSKSTLSGKTSHHRIIDKAGGSQIGLFYLKRLRAFMAKLCDNASFTKRMTASM